MYHTPEISTGHLHQFKSPDFGRGFFVSGGTWLMKASPSCAHLIPGLLAIGYAPSAAHCAT